MEADHDADVVLSLTLASIHATFDRIDVQLVYLLHKQHHYYSYTYRFHYNSTQAVGL